MNQKEFIKEVATRAEKSQKEITEIMESMEAVLLETMATEEVKLFNGMTLSTVTKEARTARNPQTGEMIDVAAKVAPKCKFGKAFKEAF